MTQEQHCAIISYMRYLGPYLRPDGRKFMVSIDENAKRSSTLYSRYLMEQHLGRKLDPNLETVDHINQDKTDDRIENLQILTRSEHAKKDARPLQLVDLVCLACSKKFKRSAGQEKHNRKQRKTGPFCSHRCVGKTYH